MHHPVCIWLPGFGGSPLTWAGGSVWLGLGGDEKEPISGKMVGVPVYGIGKLMNEPAVIVSPAFDFRIQGRERSSECVFFSVNRIF